MRLEKMDNVDWCHLCGRRSEKNISVWYPKNAEHAEHGKDTEYIRICALCAQRIVDEYICAK